MSDYQEVTAQGKVTVATIVGTTAAAAVFWLTVAGVSPGQSVVSLIVLTVIPTLGYPFTRYLLKTSAVRLNAALVWYGPGIGVGLFLMFASRMVVSKEIFMGILAFNILLSVVLLVRFIRMARGRGLNFGIPMRAYSSLPMQFFAAISCMGLLLQADWWWTLPISIFALLAIVVSVVGLRHRRVVTGHLLGFGLLLVGVLLALEMRAELWWISYNNDDDPWFHLISHGLIEWGPRVRPDADALGGLQASAYHHLAYFLAGILDIFWPSPALFVISRVLPVVTAVVALTSIHLAARLLPGKCLGDEHFALKHHVAVGAFCLAVVVSGVPSDFLAAGLLVGLIAIAPTVALNGGPLQYAITTLLLVASVAFAKGTYLYAAVIILATVAALSRIRRSMFLFPIVSGVGVFLYFRQSTPSHSIDFGLFSSGSLGEHSASTALHSRLLAILLVLTPVALGICAVVVAKILNGKRANRSIYVGLTLVMLAAVLTRLVTEAMPRVHWYLFQPGIIASGVTVMLLFLEQPSASKVRILRHLGMWILMALAWSALVQVIVPDLNSGSAIARALRMLRRPDSLNLIAATIVLLVVWIPQYVRSVSVLRTHKRIAVSAPLLILALFVGTSSWTAARTFLERNSSTQSGDEDAWRERVVGDSNAVDVATALRTRNKSDGLAAYSLCGDDIARGCTPPFLIGAFAESRFLHLGAFSEFWGFVSDTERSDYMISTTLFNTQPAETFKSLKSRGVSFLIIDLRRASPEWKRHEESRIARKIYQNEGFALWSLEES